MKKNLLVLFASAAVLSACGGGGGDDVVTPSPAPATAVPDSAAASVQSFFDYLVWLVSSASETATPLSISAGFNPPTSETEPPRSLP